MATIPATGIAAQGISAAIVYNAIDKISGMINTAESAMASSVGSQINAALAGIPTSPKSVEASYPQEWSGAQGRRTRLKKTAPRQQATGVRSSAWVPSWSFFPRRRIFGLVAATDAG